MVRDYAFDPTKFRSYFYPDLIQDEVRILDYPRSASQVYQTWFGAPPNLGAVAPRIIQSKTIAGQKTDEKPELPNKIPATEILLGESDRKGFRLPPIRGKSLLNRR
jgi:hypothetical protein